MAGGESPHGPHKRVVSQAFTDTGAIDERGDPDPAEVIRRTDTGQLQELRRAEGAGAQDDLPVGEGLVRTPATAVFDSDGTAVADDHAVYQALVTTVRLFWCRR